MSIAEAPAVVSRSEHDIVAKPLRRPLRWVAAAALLFFAGVFIYAIATNENIDYAVIGEYMFNERILNGVALTIVITAISMTLATVLAILLAAMRLSGNPVMVAFAALYVWLFRGTPLLVQIVLWGYLGLLFDQIVIGIPFTSIEFFAVDTNVLITALVAGILALTLNEAAYAAEIVRSGMLSVDGGQQEAAASLGMSPSYTFRRILLPQAMRVIIPPMGNELISMIKNTSLLSLIAVMEVYTQATQISAQNLKQVELLAVVSVWYLIIVTALSIPQSYLERRYGRGVTRNQPKTTLDRVKALTGSVRVLGPTSTSTKERSK